MNTLENLTLYRKMLGLIGVYIIFLTLAQNIGCGYTLRPLWGLDTLKTTFEHFQRRYYLSGEHGGESCLDLINGREKFS